MLFISDVKNCDSFSTFPFKNASQPGQKIGVLGIAFRGNVDDERAETVFKLIRDLVAEIFKDDAEEVVATGVKIGSTRKNKKTYIKIGQSAQPQYF